MRAAERDGETEGGEQVEIKGVEIQADEDSTGRTVPDPNTIPELGAIPEQMSFL